MMIGDFPFDNFASTPEEIFRVIDNQSVSRIEGISLIERYGWQKAKEAVEEFRKGTGVDLGEEMEERIDRISDLINELYEKTVEALREIQPPRKGKRNGMGRK
jgi:hypothetical protein